MHGSAYERKVREDKMRTQMAQAKKDNEFYRQNVDKAKMIKDIEARKSHQSDSAKRDLVHRRRWTRTKRR